MAHPPSIAFQVTKSHDGTLSKSPQGSHILGECPPSYSSQRHQTHNHFEWSAHEHSYPLHRATTLAHAFSTPTKVTEFGSTLSCCICQNAFCTCPHFTCPISLCSNWPRLEMACCWTLSKCPQCPHFAYMSTKLLPTKTSDQQPLWMSCSWTSLLPSSAPKPANVLITLTKVNLSGLIPSCHIGWKSCSTFSGCPSFTYFASFWFHGKSFNCTVPGAIAAISAATHGRFHQSSSQRASHVFLYLKSRYLSSIYSQKSRSRFFSKQNTCTMRTKAVDRERNKTRKLATAVVCPLFLSNELWEEEVQCTAKVGDGYNAIEGAQRHIAASSSWSTSLFFSMSRLSCSCCLCALDKS